MEKAVEEKINEDNALYLISNKMGLTQPYSFQLLKDNMEKENRTRKAKLQQGIVFYGKEEFTLEEYYDWNLSNIKTDVVEYLYSECDDYYREDCEKYYNENSEEYRELSEIVFKIDENGGSVYVDDFNMTVNSDFDTLAIENGKLTVTYRENLTEEISKEDFTLNAVSSLDEETIIPLEITEVTKISENTAEIAFNPIEASPVEQTITVDVDYKGQTFVLDYVIDANGEELDKGTISNFTADKISCYAEFETLPTVAPEQSDFTLQRKINDGAFEEVEIKSYSFDRTAKKKQALAIQLFLQQTSLRT